MSARELLQECREEMAGCCDSQRPTRGMEALITRIDAHLSEPVAMPPEAQRYLLYTPVGSSQRIMSPTDIGNWVLAADYDALRKWALGESKPERKGR